MNKSIDLYLVSGFLGSGKTSFLKNMLKKIDHRKTGVLVNEFGPASIDSIRLSEGDLKMIEINNGSIFCTCLKADFLKALVALSREDIDTLLIENSGLADPSNMRILLGEIGGLTAKKYNYRGSICLVNAQSFLKHVQVLPSVQNQVAHSTFVVVNKVDKVNTETLGEVTRVIRRINPLAYTYQAIFAEVPLTVIENKLVDSMHCGETSNKPGNRIETYAIETDEELTIDEIDLFVNSLKPYAYRIKGYVRTQSSWVSVDVAEDDVNITEAALEKRDILVRTKLVIIGKNADNITENIENAWKEISSGKISIYH